MSLIAKVEPKVYENPEEGTYPAICCDLEEPEPKEFQNRKNPKQMDLVPQVRYLFLINALMKDGRPFMVRRQFSNSFYPNSGHRIFIDAWKGKTTSDEDAAKGINLEQFAIGRPCLVTVEHKVVITNGVKKTYANIKTIMPLPKGMEAQVPSLDGYVRMKDREKRPDQVLAEQAKQMMDGDQVPF